MGLARRNVGELVLASLFQLLALAWLVGVGAFLGAVVGWVLLGGSAEPGTWGPLAAIALGLGVQAWVTVRSLVTLALLRVTFIRRLVAKEAARPDR